MKRSIEIEMSVIENNNISSGAKVLYVVLAYFDNKDGCIIVSNNELANMLGSSRRSAMAYIRELKKAGVIDTVIEYDTPGFRRITINDVGDE